MFGDMIRETSTTTGTGAFTTSGATAGYQTFLAAIGSGKVCVYRARNLNSPSEWETGVGTVAAGSLSRATVLASSNGGALVNFSAGTKEIIGTAHSGGLLSKVSSKAAAYTVLAADFGAVLACSGTWSLTLPAVAGLGNGWSCWVKNTGSGTITLDPNASETIDGATTAPLAAGESALIVCSGAAWVTIKGGSSGSGWAVASKTAAYTVGTADKNSYLTCSGTWTLSLTAAATLGAGFVVAVKNSGSGTITLDPNASETINGQTTLPLSAGDSLMLICDGSGWHVMGSHITPSTPVDGFTAQIIDLF